jgi:hypothetical protein
MVTVQNLLCMYYYFYFNNYKHGNFNIVRIYTVQIYAQQWIRCIIVHLYLYVIALESELSEVEILSGCRYVHIGPKLCSLLVRPEETDEVDGVSSDSCQYVSLQELWHHLSLPPNITLMLCSNGIQQHRIQSFPSNVLFVQYGFQVCALKLYTTSSPALVYTDTNNFCHYHHLLMSQSVRIIL